MIHIVEDINCVIDWLETVDSFCLDTETVRKGNSPLKMDYYDTEVIMVQIGDKFDQFIIDTRKVDISKLKPYLEGTKLKIGHNIKYDYCVLFTSFGITLENVYDTMIVDQLLYNGLDYEFSLEKTLLRHTGLNPYSDQLSLFDPFIPKSTRTKFDNPFTYAQIFYGATDIISTARVYEKQLSLIQEMENLVNLENEFVLVAGDIELNGLPINVDKWLDLEELKTQEILKVEESLRKVADINWNSSKQVLTVFKSLDIPVELFDNSTGELKETVAASSFTASAKDKFPLIKEYLGYKELRKAVSSYGSKFLKKINPTTNRIHTNIFQILHTGRTSSNSVNLQNIIADQEYRECFESNNYLVACDFSNQEMHVLANKANEQIIIDGFNNGLDMHKLTGSIAYEVAYDDCTSEQRRVGKTVNFGIVYGIGPQKIARQFEMPVYKAKSIVKNYFKKYTKLETYFTECHNEVLTKGVISIDELGRKYISPDFIKLEYLSKVNPDPDIYVIRYDKRLKREIKIPVIDIVEKEKSRISAELMRLSQNYKIQGTSASMSKLAGVLLRRAQKTHKDLYKILILIHDEWIVESKKPELAAEILKQCMSEAAEFFIKKTKIKTDVSITKYWKK